MRQVTSDVGVGIGKAGSVSLPGPPPPTPTRRTISAPLVAGNGWDGCSGCYSGGAARCASAPTTSQFHSTTCTANSDQDPRLDKSHHTCHYVTIIPHISVVIL